LYFRLSDEKPYCDLFYSSKFPGHLKNTNEKLFERFHSVYDDLEAIHKEIKDLLSLYLVEQKYDGNNMVLKLSPKQIYELYDVDEHCTIDTMIRTMLKNSSIEMPFYSVIKFINDN
jgi:hypothetical protein